MSSVRMSYLSVVGGGGGVVVGLLFWKEAIVEVRLWVCVEASTYGFFYFLTSCWWLLSSSGTNFLLGLYIVLDSIIN